MGSALFELVIFSPPSAIYARRLRRSRSSRARALSAIGLRSGQRPDYVVALVLIVPVTAVAVVLLNVIPGGVLHGHSKNLVGAPSTIGDYVAIVLLALAEEMLFRGFLAGLLFRRFGFPLGNALQALAFVAPHCLLLLVRLSLWPILPLQLIAGWVLGWLRARSDSIGPSWLLNAVTNMLPALLFSL
jgi:membrane protease YdiL (CAAX protease family)